METFCGKIDNFGLVLQALRKIAVKLAADEKINKKKQEFEEKQKSAGPKRFFQVSLSDDSCPNSPPSDQSKIITGKRNIAKWCGKVVSRNMSFPIFAKTIFCLFLPRATGSSTATASPTPTATWSGRSPRRSASSASEFNFKS